METLVLLAADGHDPPPLVDIDGTIFIQFAIFMLLLVALTKLVFRPYLALLAERDANIAGAKDEASAMLSQTDTHLATYEDKITAARREASTSRLALREEGEQAAAELLKQVRGETEAKVESSRAKIRRDTEASRLALRMSADRIATAITAKLLGREVKP